MKNVYIKNTNNICVEDEFLVIDAKEITPKDYTMASINDLIDDVCNNGEPIKGLIQVKEGIYTWDAIEIPGDENLGLEDEVEWGYIPL